VILILILALAAAGTALALLARAVLLPRMRTGESVSQIGAYGLGRNVLPREGGPVSSRLGRLAARVGNRLSFGEARRKEAQKLLFGAGIYRLAPATFLGYRLLAGVGFGVALFWVSSLAGHPLIGIPVSVYGGFIAWLVPLFVLRSRARERLRRIELEMPELIDLLVVTLEAGLGFSTALQRSAARMQGPLGQELTLTLQEYGLGLSVEQSLKNMVERGDAPAVRAFVRAVTQGQELGISIGEIMRSLGNDLRKRRRQLVEERAQKAPIKILFPLAFLILPVIFIVVLYPGLANVLEFLGS